MTIVAGAEEAGEGHHGLWAYMTELSDGSVCVISVVGPKGRGPQMLIGRSRRFVERVLRTAAQVHAAQFKRRVWLRQYTAWIDHEEA